MSPSILSSKIDWNSVKSKLKLTEEEKRIVEMLASKRSLPDIGKELGQHRSMIWRKVEGIKARLVES